MDPHKILMEEEKLERLCSTIDIEVDRIVELFKQSLELTDNEEVLQNIEQVFMQSTREIIHSISGINVLISEMMYLKVKSNPKTDTLFQEIKIECNMISKYYSIIIGAFQLQKNSVDIRAINKVEKKKRKIKRTIISLKKRYKEISSNSEPIKLNQINFLDMKKMGGGIGWTKAFTNPTPRDTNKVKFNTTRSKAKISKEDKKKEFLELISTATELLTEVENKVNFKVDDKVELKVDTNLFNVDIPSLDEYLDTEVMQFLNDFGYDWAFTRMKNHTSHLLKFKNSIIFEKEQKFVDVNENFLKESMLVVKSLEEDLWWLAKLYDNKIKFEIDQQKLGGESPLGTTSTFNSRRTLGQNIQNDRKYSIKDNDLGMRGYRYNSEVKSSPESPVDSFSPINSISPPNSISPESPGVTDNYSLSTPTKGKAVGFLELIDEKSPNFSRSMNNLPLPVKKNPEFTNNVNNNVISPNEKKNKKKKKKLNKRGSEIEKILKEFKEVNQTSKKIKIFSEKKREKEMKENDYLNFSLEEMMKQFETNCYNILNNLLPPKVDIQIIEQYKKSWEKLASVEVLNIISKNIQNSNLRESIVQIVNQTFDEYTGLKQMNDFRSVPHVFNLMRINGLLKFEEMIKTMATNLNVLLDFKKIGEEKILNKAISTSNFLADEYNKFKVAVLENTGLFSSISETNGLQSLNSMMAKEYLSEVFLICNDAIEDIAKQFNMRLSKLYTFKETDIKRVFEDMNTTRIDFDKSLRRYLSEIKPWTKSCINLHLESILQREVFGKSRIEILELLKESKSRMIEGFKTLLNNLVPEPLFQLDLFLISLDTSIEKIIGKEFGKEFSSRNRSKGISKKTISVMKIKSGDISLN